MWNSLNIFEWLSWYFVSGEGCSFYRGSQWTWTHQFPFFFACMIEGLWRKQKTCRFSHLIIHNIIFDTGELVLACCLRCLHFRNKKVKTVKTEIRRSTTYTVFPYHNIYCISIPQNILLINPAKITSWIKSDYVLYLCILFSLVCIHIGAFIPRTLTMRDK